MKAADIHVGGRYLVNMDGQTDSVLVVAAQSQSEEHCRLWRCKSLTFDKVYYLRSARRFVAGLTPDGNDEANAKRIVACVNACEGINPKAVPKMLATLQNLAEYWNRNENHAAMVDALWHTINSAQAVIADAKKVAT